MTKISHAQLSLGLSWRAEVENTRGVSSAYAVRARAPRASVKSLVVQKGRGQGKKEGTPTCEGFCSFPPLRYSLLSDVVNPVVESARPPFHRQHDRAIYR